MANCKLEPRGWMPQIVDAVKCIVDLVQRRRLSVVVIICDGIFFFALFNEVAVVCFMRSPSQALCNFLLPSKRTWVRSQDPNLLRKCWTTSFGQNIAICVSDLTHELVCYSDLPLRPIVIWWKCSAKYLISDIKVIDVSFPSTLQLSIRFPLLYAKIEDSAFA